jgi:hypothetical protein
MPHGFVLLKRGTPPKRLTDAQRVDELGLMKEQVADLESKLKRKGLLGKKIAGNLFEATIYGRHSTKLNRTKLLKLISEEQLQACMVTSKTESICLSVKRIKAAS